MRVVYIAGPFRGPNAWAIHRNVSRAEELAYEVARAGAMPLCPHTNSAHFHGTLSDRFWLEGTMELLRRADAVILVEGWRESSGTCTEVAEAHSLEIPVFVDGPSGMHAFRTWLREDSTAVVANGGARQ